MSAQPEDIVGTIRALLSGDRSVDVPFIKKQRDNYAAHPQADVIVAELNRMLGEIKRLAEFEAIMAEQRRQCEAVMRDAAQALKRNDLARAELLLRTMADHDSQTSDWKTAYYDFQDPIERLYVEAMGEEKREVRDALLPMVGINQMLCAVLLQDNRTPEALLAIDKAISLNKVAIMPRLERTYCLQRLRRWDELRDYLIQVFPLCWTQMHFGQWYRALAPWFFHTQDFEGFGACLMLSLACVEDAEARKLLEVAEQLSEIPYDDEFAESVPQLARDRNIPLHPAPIWYDLAMRLARQTLEDESWDKALRYLHIAYDLNRNPELMEQIERLRAHMASLA